MDYVLYNRNEMTISPVPEVKDKQQSTDQQSDSNFRHRHECHSHTT